MEFNCTLLTTTEEVDPVEDIAINRGFRLILVEITGALCIVLNSLNIAVLRKAPHCFGESTTLLFTTLAVVDLSTGVIIMFSEIFYVLTEIPNKYPEFCVLIYPLIVLFGILSAMLLACLSFDKLIAITRPLRYSQIVTQKRVKFVVVGVVLLSAMNMIGYWTLILRDSSEIMYFHQKSLYCRMHMEESNGDRSNAITLLQTFGFICMLLPLIIVTYVNLRLLFIVYQHNRRQSIAPFATSRGQIRKSATSMTLVNGGSSPRGSPCCSPDPNRRESSMHPPPSESRTTGKDRRTSSRVSLALLNLKALRKHRESNVSVGTHQRRSHYKGLRTVLVMVIAYYLAWMPLLVDVCINIILNNATSATLEFVTFFMAYSNSWWNALVYLLMNSAYRAAAYRIIRCDRY
ncbi:uncharacterized protein [Apostichopus japonicus]